MYLKNVKVGDTLTRMLGGQIPLKVIVGEVNENTILVGSADGRIPYKDGWTFSRLTGGEIDEDLGWDGITHTGSFIKL